MERYNTHCTTTDALVTGGRGGYGALPGRVN